MFAAAVGVVSVVLFFVFEALRDTEGFLLSHVHKLAVYTPALCSESAYLVCHCFLITLHLGFNKPEESAPKMLRHQMPQKTYAVTGEHEA